MMISKFCSSISINSIIALISGICLFAPNTWCLSDDNSATTLEKQKSPSTDTAAVQEKAVCAVKVDSMNKAEEKEAMAVGGLVTLDYASPIDNFNAQTLTLGRIELRAVVNVNCNVKGFITLLTEGDLRKIRVYQAAADLNFNKMPLEIIAGQQIFNHGLMTTRLVNYPLGYELVLPNQPGVSVAYSLGNFKIGAAALMTENVTKGPTEYVISASGNTVELPGTKDDSTQSIGGIVSADYAFAEGSSLHGSTLLSKNKIDIDLAISAVVKKVTIDAEIYDQLKTNLETGKAATYCLGALYAISDNVGVAVRNDGRSANQFKDMTMLYASGLVVKVFGDCYVACEYDYTKPARDKAVNLLALEFGLQSTLKLPGFQRKSLTNGE